MIVKVVIDIPAKQVNRSFDYAVPKDWESAIKLGSRVQVPFGNMKRTGFVVDITNETEFNGKLKPIHSIMDYDVFLNEELIELSDYLAEYLQCFRISVLQAMLPSLLKAKYDAIVQIHDPVQFSEKVSSWYQNETSIDRKVLEERISPNAISQLKKENIISIEYQVINQTTQKTKTMLKANLNKEQLMKALEETSQRSFKQRAILEYFINNQNIESVEKSNLMSELEVSNATINSAIDKEWITTFKEVVYRDPLKDVSFQASSSKTLLPEQQNAYELISQSVDNKQADTYLIEGVTGSGKTEIYLQLMDRALQQGKSALLLVPEISLTPQMVERVVSRFQTGIAVLHSGLSITEKYDEWQRIIKGEAKIVVGARSSIFAPLENIGIIIIDEEHETTYKQSDNPRYHARDVARWRSEYHNAPLILGSATPSLESRARAQVGNYHLIHLENRVNQMPMPPVDIIDMTQVELRETANELSPELIEKIQDRLDKKEQVVLLQNRRGYASYLLCRECGFIMQCPRCDISLTYHKFDNQMKCHYCDYHEPLPTQCPSCQSPHIRTHGIGTQKVAETLEEIFPEAKVTRMDNDTTRRKGQHQKLLDEFSSGQSNILLGTQMIAKGLDFENVTLVGVINADTALNLPDFRASERTFQLLTQVSGRTGRGRLAGEVVIQTYNPEHYVIQFAKTHDYENFFRFEMKRRHLTNYPPYYFTTLLTVSSKHQGKASQLAYDLKAQLYNPELERKEQLYIIGPNRNNISKINNYYYFNLLLKYKDKTTIQRQLDDILNNTQQKATQGVYVNIDHEPQYFS
ncbi:primosomal protein N' [Ruoffia tabacinasalis]|uniref:primosomal protein N' n=1 Tax=Ruoffia tabacinasalis TaxID=87458 RepID=UPI003F947C64